VKVSGANLHNARVSIVTLTATQTALLECLRAAVRTAPSRQVVYCAEWLGYLPFGAYYWVEVEGKDIPTRSLPADWRFADLDALAVAGLLTRVSEWRNPEDECEKRITFEVNRPQPHG
jgi:hypothetical protein